MFHSFWVTAWPSLLLHNWALHSPLRPRPLFRSSSPSRSPPFEDSTTRNKTCFECHTEDHLMLKQKNMFIWVEANKCFIIQYALYRLCFLYSPELTNYVSAASFWFENKTSLWYNLTDNLVLKYRHKVRANRHQVRSCLITSFINRRL